ncbi:MAG: IS66 family transposase [Bacteroides sp.]|nr:IS66 family transposase [Bacteroides sp.]
MADVHPPRGDLMETAVCYLHILGNQLFAYLKGDCYSIDNFIAKRFIRPLDDERKNSLFFGGDTG